MPPQSDNEAQRAEDATVADARIQAIYAANPIERRNPIDDAWRAWRRTIALATGPWAVCAAGYAAGVAHATTANPERLAAMEGLLREMAENIELDSYGHPAHNERCEWRDWQTRIAALLGGTDAES